jgi:hypothetical protein
MSDRQLPIQEPVKAPIPDAGPNTALGSALCTQCGLCCTGAIHSFAVLDPDEVDFAGGLGLTIRTSDRPGFALPCPLLEDSVCTVYGNRPRVCGNYKCRLLRDLEAGSVTLDLAIGKVRTAKALVRQVEQSFPENMTLPEARTFLPAFEADSTRRPAEMSARLAITALTLYLDTHFRHSREVRTLSVETIGEGPPDPEMT